MLKTSLTLYKSNKSFYTLSHPAGPSPQGPRGPRGSRTLRMSSAAFDAVIDMAPLSQEEIKMGHRTSKK